jgi:hypothetical protein
LYNRFLYPEGIKAMVKYSQFHHCWSLYFLLLESVTTKLKFWYCGDYIPDVISICKSYAKFSALSAL